MESTNSVCIDRCFIEMAKSPVALFRLQFLRIHLACNWICFRLRPQFIMHVKDVSVICVCMCVRFPKRITKNRINKHDTH